VKGDVASPQGYTVYWELLLGTTLFVANFKPPLLLKILGSTSGICGEPQRALSKLRVYGILDKSFLVVLLWREYTMSLPPCFHIPLNFSSSFRSVWKFPLGTPNWFLEFSYLGDHPM